MKIPHGQVVSRGLRNVSAATKKALRGLNLVAAKRLGKGDYSGAEAIVAKGREVRQFQEQVSDLLRAWRQLSRSGPGSAGTKADTTPLWGYYQPVLKAIVAAGGECTRQEIEAALERLSDGWLQPGDRQLMSGGRERWRVMIRRTRRPLKAEGWLTQGSGKTWKITETGRKAAERDQFAAGT